MTIRTVGCVISCRSHAKINLYLDVLRKRGDGYHQLETIFQTVSLHDELICEATENGLSLEIEGADLAVDDDNLVLRAARALQNRTGTSQGASMRLRKAIPVAAGLAGGSGNAAAALRGLNRLWALGLQDDELEFIASELGSDVPYCLYGGTMAGTGRGEELARLQPLPKTWLVLAHPDVSVSTPEIFGHSSLVTSDAQALGDGRSAAFSEAVTACAEGRIGAVLFNALESAALIAYPVIAACKRALADAGCSHVLMSGSGPTVFGICGNRDEAERVAGRVAGFRTSVVHTVDCGARLD